MANVIKITGLAKRYRGVAALADVTAAIPAGQVVGLLGHNGAGKSTLIKLVLGLIEPSAGNIKVFDTPPWRSSAVAFRRRIGYLPENVAFWGNLTGREVIAYLADLKCVARSEAYGLLDKVGLADAGGRRVRTYSKGMRQRLGLAQALLGKPDLVVLDEPTSGLDPQATHELYETVDELRTAGRSVLISSHVLAELEPHIDTALVLRHGRLVATGSVDALRRQSGLPDLVRVYLRNAADAAGFIGKLHAGAVRAARCSGGCIDIEVAAADKLDLVRKLVVRPEVADVGIREVSLARLYAQLGEAIMPVEETP